jgi:hypothetical protein
MRTDCQIEASRANGSKSRGPVTEKGKRASSRNAIKHGILSECVLLPGESPESFQSLAAGLFEEFHPVGSTEEDLVEVMAVARWRRMRVWSVEKNCLTGRMASTYRDSPEPKPSAEATASLAFAALANETRTLDLINRYESRYDRQYFRAHRRLLELQDRRMRNEPNNPPPPPAPLTVLQPATPSEPVTTPADPGPEPVTPGVSAENSISSRQTRLPHWHSAFTPFENIVNALPRRPLQPESPGNAAVFAAVSGIEQS